MNLIEISFAQPQSSSDLIKTIIPGLATALVAGIVLFLLNWGREVVTARIKRLGEAEVLAFFLATQLDRLISDCTDVVLDDGTYDPDTDCRETTVATPKVNFPDDLNWGVFDKRLQYRIRALPNKIGVALRTCAHEAEYGDGPPDYEDYFEERILGFARIGLEACLISGKLTRDFGVEVLDRGEWDPQDDFEWRIRTIEDRRLAETESKVKEWGPPLFKPSIEELEERKSILDAKIAEAMIKMESSN